MEQFFVHGFSAGKNNHYLLQWWGEASVRSCCLFGDFRRYGLSGRQILSGCSNGGLPLLGVEPLQQQERVGIALIIESFELANVAESCPHLTLESEMTERGVSKEMRGSASVASGPVGGARGGVGGGLDAVLEMRLTRNGLARWRCAGGCAALQLEAIGALVELRAGGLSGCSCTWARGAF